jgi:hypothetical protein
MSIATTNIDELPVNGGQENQIKKEVDQPSLAENEIISGIQKAASSGMTALPSRDIPLDKSAIQSDEQVKPSFIPQNSEGDYITKHQTSDEILKQHNKKQQEKDKIDELYNELSMPILISVIYFMYHLPIVRVFLIKTFPIFYEKSGDINLSGRLANSVIFGSIIYVFGKVISQLSN